MIGAIFPTRKLSRLANSFFALAQTVEVPEPDYDNLSGNESQPSIISPKEVDNKLVPKPEEAPKPSPSTVSRWQILYAFHKNFGQKYLLDYSSYQAEMPIIRPDTFEFKQKYEDIMWGPTAKFEFKGKLEPQDQAKMEQVYQARFPKLIKVMGVSKTEWDVYQMTIQFNPNVMLT